MMSKFVLACAVACAFAGPAGAQTAPAAATPALQPASTDVLRAGTPVALTMREELTTKGKKLTVGQRFQMAVAQPVMVGTTSIIPAGTPAVGEVTAIRNKGMWGKSGRINARVLYLTVNGRQVRMSGQIDDKGTTGTAGVVAAIAVLPVAGFFTTGTSATVPLGAAVNGFIDEDVPVASAATPVAPLAVAAPAGSQ